jgi:hypothetical protein
MASTRRNPTQLLDIEVQQLPWSVTDIADRLTGQPVGVAEPRTASSHQDSVDRRAWQLQDGAESMRSPALMAADGQHPLLNLVGQAVGTVVRP